MTKKIIALLLAATLITTSLTGCGSSASKADDEKNVASGTTTLAKSESTPAGEKKEITLWFWGVANGYDEHFRKVVEEMYNSTQEEYKLTIEFRNTVDNDVPVALAAGSGPDIVYSSGPSFAAVYALENKILPLDSYAEQYGWKDKMPSVLYNACTLNGKLYSIPSTISFDGIFYSKSLFKEKGWEVPKTIDDLEKIFSEASTAGIYPSAIGNKGWRPNNDTFASIMVNHFASPSLLYDGLTGKEKFDNPELQSAVAKTKDWYDKGYIGGKDYTNLNSLEWFQLLSEKRAAIVFAQSKFFQHASASFTGDLQDDLGFAPMPSAYPTEMPVYNLEIPCTFAINAASKYPDECAKIMDLFFNEDFMMKMTQVWPGHWAGAIKDRTANTDELTGIGKMYMDAVKEASKSIDSGYYGFNASTFFPPKTAEKWRDIDMVWQGVLTPEEYLQEIDKTIKEEIAAKLVCPLAKPVV
ncbi:MAG: extracellular solute-binding protein [Ruthenibacterium sp.]